MDYDLSISSFINSFRRFIGQRGLLPKREFSDNITNFVGAELVLRNALQELNQIQLDNYFHQSEINWKFNPPSASHMGRAHEKTVRSILRILSALINKGQSLTDETLSRPRL